MSNTKLEQLEKEFSALNSSKQKLDYWKENFYNRFMKEANLMDSLGNIIGYKPIYEEENIIADTVIKYFDCEALHTSAKIPAEIHLKHFPNFERDIEYTNWFLIFNAEKWARGYYIFKFQSNLGNPITDELIEAELNELQLFEKNAASALKSKEIKIEDDYPKPNLKPFLELKRIQSNYYEDKVVPSFNILGGDSVVDIYAKQVLFKAWLNEKYESGQKRDKLTDRQFLTNKFDELNERIDILEKKLLNTSEYIIKQIDFIEDSLNNSRNTTRMNSGEIKIFLASSSEMRDDRDAFDLYFRQENDHLREQGIYLKIVRWENGFLDAMSETRLQDEYNKEIKNCDVFVGLFLTKTGKFTEEEFDVAYQHFLEIGKPKIFTLFKNNPIDIKDITQEINTLLQFKERLKELNHFYTEYKNTEGLLLFFKDRLRLLMKGQ